MDLNSSIIYLEEYLKLPKVKSTVDDFNLFIDSISFIASLDNAYPFEISEKLYKSKILPMTKEQVRTYLNLLGHLNILHHPKTVGIANAFTSASDIDILDHMYTKSTGNEFTYPFRLYNTAFGVDFSNCKVEDVLYLSKEIKKYGIGGIFPTLVTDTVENIKKEIIDLKGKEVNLYINRGRRKISIEKMAREACIKECKIKYEKSRN